MNADCDGCRMQVRLDELEVARDENEEMIEKLMCRFKKLEAAAVMRLEMLEEAQDQNEKIIERLQRDIQELKTEVFTNIKC
jgi:hypothetical protein